MILRTVQGFI